MSSATIQSSHSLKKSSLEKKSYILSLCVSCTFISIYGIVRMDVKRGWDNQGCTVVERAGMKLLLFL